MSKERDVVVLVGSLRKQSINRRAAKSVLLLAPPALHLEVVEIGDLALYDADLENNLPPPWVAFRQRIQRADAVLFITPEYNRSIPAPLKNAVDVGSRPYGKSSWSGKPAAIISTSPGQLGAFGANHHLRQALVFLNMPAMQQPEAYIGDAAALFNEDGSITVDATRDFLAGFLKSFAAWIDANAKA
jgi:chromate reductase